MDPRKNLEFLIGAFAKSSKVFSEDYNLIITCHIDPIEKNKMLNKKSGTY